MVKIGMKHDKRGREMWYRDGKRVAGQEIPQTVRERAGGALSYLDYKKDDLCLYRSGDGSWEKACKTSTLPLQKALIAEILKLPEFELGQALDAVKVNLKKEDFKATWVEFAGTKRYGLRAILQKNARGQYRLLFLFTPRMGMNTPVPELIEWITSKSGDGTDAFGDAMELLGNSEFKRLSAAKRAAFISATFPA